MKNIFTPPSTITKKVARLTLLLAISFSSGICQELDKNKNVVSVDYTFYQGDKFDGGDALAQGIVIRYSDESTPSFRTKVRH